MRIALASDHGGFALKETIKAALAERGFAVVDLGSFDGETSVDYPDFAGTVAKSLLSGETEQGVLICGTGIGMSIAANKYPGVRAALVHDLFTARMAREHNNANVLVMGGRVLDKDGAVAMVNVWLDARFEGERHQRRLDKIAAIERDVSAAGQDD